MENDGKVRVLRIWELLQETDAEHPISTAQIERALYERWGIADERWRLIPDTAFARSLPVTRADGTAAAYSFTLMPGWSKARWRNGVLQPAKFYLLGKAGVLKKDDPDEKGGGKAGEEAGK